MSYKGRDRARLLIEARLTKKQKAKLKKAARVAGHAGMVYGGIRYGGKAGEVLGGKIGRVASKRILAAIAKKRGRVPFDSAMLASIPTVAGQYVGSSLGALSGAELAHLTAKKTLYSKKRRRKLERGPWGGRLFKKQEGPEATAIRYAGIGAGAVGGMVAGGKIAQRLSRGLPATRRYSRVGKAAVGGAAIGAFAGLVTASVANRRIWNNKKKHPRNMQPAREAVDELLATLEEGDGEG
jgi:hypothetical protein